MNIALFLKRHQLLVSEQLNDQLPAGRSKAERGDVVGWVVLAVGLIAIAVLVVAFMTGFVQDKLAEIG